MSALTEIATNTETGLFYRMTSQADTSIGTFDNDVQVDIVGDTRTVTLTSSKIMSSQSNDVIKGSDLLDDIAQMTHTLHNDKDYTGDFIHVFNLINGLTDPISTRTQSIKGIELMAKLTEISLTIGYDQHYDNSKYRLLSSLLNKYNSGGAFNKLKLSV